MNLGVLELKWQEVHLADKFFEAELARLRRTCPQNLYPDAKLEREGVLGYL